MPVKIISSGLKGPSTGKPGIATSKIRKTAIGSGFSCPFDVLPVSGIFLLYWLLHADRQPEAVVCFVNTCGEEKSWSERSRSQSKVQMSRTGDVTSLRRLFAGEWGF